MALYKHPLYVSLAFDELFDETYPPGSIAPYPGIYRCTACGDEIAIAKGHTLPPQNHRQHSPELGNTAWQLLVMSQQQA